MSDHCIDEEDSVLRAREVLRIEAESIAQLIPKLDRNFAKAVDLIFRSTGRVIVTGIGKSGLIGKKIVATMTSTGTPAIFLHPVEGMHGDLGIVTKDDVMIAISNSGETSELNPVVESIRRIGVPLVALTGQANSTLGRFSDVVIDVGVKREACPFNLAPTSSSTASLAMGDALAIALIGKRNFREKDFFRFHPGGNLGARLRAKVRDIMIRGEEIPRVLTGTPLLHAIEVMDNKNKGFVLIADDKNRLLGILTDGDVRRLVRQGRDFSAVTVDRYMSPNPKTMAEDASVAETIEFMQRIEITALVVIDEHRTILGYLHLHDILGRGGTLKISIT
ncbi:MAG: KpsF/GutQ family sugar-phosphate isomerase [Syntrophales bacterium]|jgi:arabinose-5-phosphate isomerase|nr:KpsF/GutQ family sugar-phosphate isomerase [Syntrophales bacterium]